MSLPGLIAQVSGVGGRRRVVLDLQSTPDMMDRTEVLPWSVRLLRARFQGACEYGPGRSTANPRAAPRMNRKQALPPTGIYTIEEPVAQPGVGIPNTGKLVVRGWCFGEVGQRVPEQVFLEITSVSTGRHERIPAMRIPRPDVAGHFGDAGLLLSGFNAEIPLGAPRFGQQIVSLLQIGPEGDYRSDAVLRIDLAAEEYERFARQGLASKFLKGQGIEIGALQKKLAVPAHCKVTYVDRLSLDDLLKHYPEFRELRVQAPDVVDDGEKLARFSDSSLDFVVANHFLEHCANPIGACGNLLRVLRPGGILFLAIPDKRYTFDIARPTTAWGAIQRAFLSGQREDREQLYREWAVHVQHLSGAQAETSARTLLEAGYSIHFNVWALDGVLEYLARARSECHLPFSLVAAVSSENEVIVVLEKT